MDNGHYTSFVLHSDNWFKCDDSFVTKTTLATVLKSKAYLLFYIRSTVSYTNGKSGKQSATTSHTPVHH